LQGKVKTACENLAEKKMEQNLDEYVDDEKVVDVITQQLLRVAPGQMERPSRLYRTGRHSYQE
jgi:hypothetical protein